MANKKIQDIDTENTEPDGTQWIEGQENNGGGIRMMLTNIRHALALATITAKGLMSAADKVKLDGVEAGADVTDAAGVAAAGAVMDGDFSANGAMERTGAGAYSAFSVTAAGKALLDDADASAQRATLGLAIGADVQAYSAVLDATTASFTAAKESKLDGIEPNAVAGLALDEIDNPGGDTTFVLGGSTIEFAYTNPVGGLKITFGNGHSGRGVEITDVGAAGDGSAGDHLVHLETARVNVTPAHLVNAAVDGAALLVDGGLFISSDPADFTRRATFNTSAVATGTTRTVVIPDQDVDLTPGAGTFQGVLSEGAFADGDKTKLDGIEAAADVTDATNVQAALTSQGYIDLPEQSPDPSNPAADTARLYSADDGGTTKLYFRDSAGAETEIGASGGGVANPLTENLDAGAFSVTNLNTLQFEGGSSYRIRDVNNGLWVYAGSGDYWEFSANNGRIWFNKNIDFTIGQTPLTGDAVTRTLTVKSQDARFTATTNLVGGDLILRSGDGASSSAGAADGGDINLVPGTGYGTGRDGLIFPNLPTSDPGVSGAMWSDSGTVKISA